MKKMIWVFLWLPFFCFSQINWSEVEVQSTELAPGLHRLFIGEGVSILAYCGDDGLLLVDAAYEKAAEKVQKELIRLGKDDLKYIINTHYHSDHTGGNKYLGENVDIIAHSHVKEVISKESGSGKYKRAAYPIFAQPNITFTDSMTLRFNNQTLILSHPKGGHTAGDIVVYFPDSKLLALGDLLFADKFPYVDINQGGNAIRYIKHLESIIDSYPEETKIIGGHGPVYTLDKLRTYHQTLEQTVKEVRGAKERGMTLEQMKKERILGNWEKYGTGFISEDFWIATVYNSL